VLRKEGICHLPAEFALFRNHTSIAPVPGSPLDLGGGGGSGGLCHFTSMSMEVLASCKKSTSR